MWQFQYKHGDRPLDGYTIQRAAGRGGFGEVYYAVSDSGREVALKAVTGYEQIELRGISQCMNLKNPHLVSIFDVKYNDQGRPFVLMEYVAGPSLRQLLDESPGGLGSQKSAFFLREIGKGLTYLHECGIVHRDLKPGNIFYENGYVKIGDYGLSKAIAPTQHSGQTITVGTVHYMAPEIGGGRYDKSIDIYAMGAVLYEMLTGQPPFLGSSAGEILLKHVSSEPDLTHVEEPFKTVVRKAMAKDPADRYQSVQEMVEAVFGAEHIQQSVSCFSPDSLSMIAQRVGQRVAVGGGSATPPPIPGSRGAATATAAPGGDRFGRMFDRVGDRIGAIGNRVADLGVHALPRNARRDFGGGSAPGDPSVEMGDPLTDPLSKRQRRTLALLLLALISVAVGFLSPLGRRHGPDDVIPGIVINFLAAAGAATGLLLAGRRILPQMNGDSSLLRKIASGGTAAAFMIIFSFFIFAAAPGRHQETLAGTALAVICSLLLIKPPDLSPSRPERVMFNRAAGAAALGFGLTFPFGGSAGLAIGILAGAHLLAQVVSPWDPFGARRRAEYEDWDEDEDGPRPFPPPPPVPGAAESPSPAPRQPSWSAAWDAAAASGDAPTMAWPPAQQAGYAPPAAPAVGRPRRPVPLFMRYLWLALCIAATSAGVMLAAYAGMENLRGEDFALAVGFGTGLMALGVLAFVKMFQKTFRGWGSYVFRWLGAWACCQSILLAGLFLGEARADVAPALFFIVFPGLLLPVLLFVRFRHSGTSAAPGAVDPAARGFAPPPVPPAPAAPARVAAPDRFDDPRPTRQHNRRKRRRHRGEPAGHSEPLLVRLFGFVRDMTVGAVVTALLTLALLVGTALALDVPGMLEAGVPHARIPVGITEKLGFASWPDLFRLVGNGVGLVALLTAALVLIVARRKTYGLHMVRAMAGVAVFGLSLMLLGRALSDGRWTRVPAGAMRVQQFGPDVHLPDPVPVEPGETVTPAPPVEPVHPNDLIIAPGRIEMRMSRGPRDEQAAFLASLEHYLRAARPGMVTWAGCVGLFSVITICWPARRAGGRGRDAARQASVQQHFGNVTHGEAPPAAAPAPAPASDDPVAQPTK